MSRVFAYARVSTLGQTTGNQLQEIAAAGFAVEPRRVVSETVSGSEAIARRPGFADQDMGEQPGTRAAALDGAPRQRRLDEPLAAGAGQPRPHDPIHDEATGDVSSSSVFVIGLERMATRWLTLADPAQFAAAVGTGVRGGAELHHHAREMVRGEPLMRHWFKHNGERGASAGPSPRHRAGAAARSSPRR